jgi:triacylglycerol esterase/lipase EstA (alpha/beta hydrolase family)
MLARALRLSLLLDEWRSTWPLPATASMLRRFAAALLTLAGMLSLRAVLITHHLRLCLGLAFTGADACRCTQALLMVLGEYAAHVAQLRHDLSLRTLVDGVRSSAGQLSPTRPELAGRRPPVLLVHGYGCSRAAWWWLRRRLEAAGWTVATISLEPIYGSIDDYVDPLARRIDAVLAETGAEHVLLVGHSMGGLVARAYLQHYGKRASRRSGDSRNSASGQSDLARSASAPTRVRCGPHSAWLQALASPAAMLDTLAIYSPHDNYVMPQSNLQLPGTASHSIEGLGHLTMLYSPRVAQVLLAALDQTCARSA